MIDDGPLEVAHHTSLMVRLRFRSPGRLLVELAGELDVASERDLGALAELLVAVDPERITLDMAGVAFVDLGGLRALRALVDDVAAHRIEVEPGQGAAVIVRLQALMVALGCDTSGSPLARPHPKSRPPRPRGRQGVSVVLAPRATGINRRP